MSKFVLSNRSIGRLEGVHPHLLMVVFQAIEETPLDFGITEGRRTKKRQRQLVKEKKSKTMNSRHITGHAIDIVVYTPKGKVSWDMRNYAKVARVFKKVAKEFEIDLEWGGDWKTFKDGPHFQLSWKAYPA